MEVNSFVTTYEELVLCVFGSLLVWDFVEHR